MNNLQITISNLQKIQKELPLLADKIPSIREEFTMRQFGCYKGSSVDKTVCKTYGCGLGNASRLFDISKKEYYGKWGFDYKLFSKYILPSISNSWSATNSLWQYLFASEWGIDSSNYKSFEDFIKRVDNVITLLKEKGAVSVKFSPQDSNNFTILN